MDTQIRFSVQGANEVRNVMRTLIAESNTLSKTLEAANSGFIDSLNTQIELLKKRNELLKQGGDSNQASIGSSSTQIVSILENIQKKGLDLSEKTIAALNGGKTPKGTDQDSEEKKKSSGKSDSNSARDSFLNGLAWSTLLRSISSRDPVQTGIGFGQNVGSSLMMMGGKAGVAGAVLSLATSVLAAQYNAYKEILPGSESLSRLLGSNISATGSNISANPYARYGILAQDYAQGQIDVTKQLGRYDRSAIDVFLKTGKAYEIDRSDLLNLIRVGRGQSNFSLGGSTQYLLGSLAGAGLSSQEASIKVPEYLKLLTELGQKQVQLLGKVDLEQNTQMLASLSRVFANPDVLRTVVTGLDEGLKRSSTPQVEALQLQALQRVSPGATLWELEKMKEKGVMQEGYLPEVLRSLMNVSGGNIEDMSRNVSNIFFGGTSKGLSEELVRAFVSAEAQGRAFTEVDVKKIMGAGEVAADKVSPVSVIEAEIQKAQLPTNIASMTQNLQKIADFVGDSNEKGFIEAAADRLTDAVSGGNKAAKAVGQTIAETSGSFGVGMLATITARLVDRLMSK